jgi:hypothetical protein
MLMLLVPAPVYCYMDEAVEFELLALTLTLAWLPFRAAAAAAAYCLAS